eukprot:15365013-Ditylum_brightwellii.AAC.3
MPSLWPLRACPQRSPHQRGNPQNWCGAERSKAGAPPLVFGGEGRWPVLYLDKGNATCFLKDFNKAQHCFYIN